MYINVLIFEKNFRTYYNKTYFYIQTREDLAEIKNPPR